MSKKIQDIEKRIDSINIRLKRIEGRMSYEGNAKTIADEVSKRIEKLVEDRCIPCNPSTKETSLVKSAREKKKDLSIVEKYIMTFSGCALKDTLLQAEKDLHERMKERGIDFCVDGRVLLAAFEIENKKKKPFS